MQYESRAERPDWQYQEAYRRASRKVKARVSFMWHLAIYIVVNLMLVFIYYSTAPSTSSGQVPWFLWALGGWGIGLMFNFLGAFVFPSAENAPVQRWMVEQELSHIESRAPPSSVGVAGR